MAGEQLPTRIDLCADRLRDAENDAAGQRSPHAAKSADDHRLESENEPRRSDGRVEIGPHGEKDPSDGNHRQRQGHRHREDVTRVEPHQLCHGLVVRSCAQRAAERCAVKQNLKSGDDGDGNAELNQRQRADPEILCQLERLDFDGACLQLAAVGRE